MRHPVPIAGLAAALLLTLPAAGSGQGPDTLRLTLAEALDRAGQGHPAVQEATAARRARDADVLASSAAFAPRVALEFGVTRSNDPVASFGGRLRQARFAEADFALAALNRPAPLNDVSTALSIEQPLLQPEAILGRRAAQAAARAGARGEDRAGQLARLEVLRGYFTVKLSDQRVAVLHAALEVAQQTLAQVSSLRRNGSVTLVDEQLARARVSEVESALAAATAGQSASLDLLLNLLGEPGGLSVVLSDSLAAPGLDAETLGAVRRFDVLALEEEVAAAEANVARARGSWVPSARAFGLLDFHSPGPGLARGPSRWTAGLVVRWTPFRGFADLGQLRRAEAERDGVRQRLADHGRRANSEVRMARAERAAALAAIAAADAALVGAAQASRMASVRYAEGVGTITELLAVRAAEFAERLARANALYLARVAEAALAVALGRDPS